MMKKNAMIDRYRWWEVILMYIGIAIWARDST